MSVARVARLTTVLVLLGTSCLVAAGTGWAGGPTSVLLVAPGYERAAALYYSDPEYQQLETLLAEPAAAATVLVALPTAGSDYITVTWLIHDVSIWRIDRVFLAKNGGQLIVNQLLDGTSAGADGMYPDQSGGDTATTHRSTDPAALGSLLDKLGLTGVAPGGAADVALPADEAVQAAAAPAQATRTTLPPSPGAAWWWMLAGLVLGIVVAATAIRYLPAVRRRFLAGPVGADDEPVRMTQLPV